MEKKTWWKRWGKADQYNLKGEIRLDENQLKNNKVMTLWLSQIFKKHSLPNRYEYENEWVNLVIALQFSCHFVHRMTKMSYFSCGKCKTWLNSFIIIIIIIIIDLAISWSARVAKS